MSIQSDPPAGPVAVSFDDTPAPALVSHSAITDPEPAPEPEPRSAEPNPILIPLPNSNPHPNSISNSISPPAPNPHPRRNSLSALLLSSSFDATLAFALTAACAFATLQIGHVRYPLDFLRDTASLWFVLAATLAAAWSLFARGLRVRNPG